MALHLHRAARTDALAAALGDLLAVAPADPFARDLVLVPAKGTERWLSQRLSHRLGSGPGSATGDGVCAAVDFRSPRSLVAELTDTVDDDAWAPGVLAWPLLEVLDASLEEPWARPLAVHLGRDLEGEEAELRRSRRYAVARRLDGYSGADIKYLCDRAAIVPFLRSIATGAEGDVSGAILAEVITQTPRSVTPEQLRRFEEWGRSAPSV